MAYRIHPDEHLAAAVHRIAHEQVDAALASATALRGRSDDAEAVAAVHDVRKRAKKLRGLVRLVRPALGDAYRPANVAFRDAARALSDLRDDHALVGTFDDLVVAAGPDGLPEPGVAGVRRALADRAAAATAGLAPDDPRVEEAVALLEEGRSGIDTWSMPMDWSAAAGGLTKTYRRARHALADVEEQPSTEGFHELRKRVKYHWYHLRLLTPVAPSVLDPWADAAHGLADALGDAHDLAVLDDLLGADPPLPTDPDQVVAARALVAEWRAELERRALAVAPRLLAEDADALVGRLGALWSVAERVGPELEVGELADLADPGDDLDDLGVDELRSLAGEHEVTGRWDMGRADLVASVRAAG